MSGMRIQALLSRHLIGVSMICLLCGAEWTDREKIWEFDIPRQRVDAALMVVARQTGTQLLFPYDEVNSQEANPLTGRYSLHEALEIMLRNTGLTARVTNSGVITVAPEAQRLNQGNEMDVNTKRGIGAFLASLFTAGTASGQGELDSQREASALDEIIVTAQKREQKLKDVPMSLVSVDVEAMKEAGISSARDLISYTPGFVITTAATSGGARGHGAIGARGISQQASTPVVGIYLDDVPLSSNSPHSNANLFFFDGMLHDLDRVEFLKGPQGTLYGAVAIGGAMKYVTSKPELNHFRVSATADVATIKDGDVSRLYRGVLSVPIVNDRVGLALSGYTFKDGGFLDQIDATSGTVIDEDINFGEGNGFSADLLASLSERLEFRGKVLQQENSWGGSNSLQISATTLQPLYGPRETSFGTEDYTLNYDIYSATFEYSFDGATLTSTSSQIEWSTSRESFIRPSESTLPALVDSQEGNPPGTSTGIDFATGGGFEKFTQEIRLTSDDSTSVEWIVGLYYADEDTTQLTTYTGQPTLFNLLTLDRRSFYKEYATFGNLTYYFTDHFDLGVGARYSRNELKFQPGDSGALAGSPVDLEDVKDGEMSYLFTLRYRPDDNHSLYARAASGFRPAYGNQPLVDPVTGELLAPAKIVADTVWNYELGAKGQLVEGLLGYELTLWYLDWSNFQTVKATIIGNQAANAEGVTGKGVEGALFLDTSTGFSAKASVNYTDSTLDEDEPELFGSAGDTLPGIEKWSFAMRARYDFPLWAGADAYLGGGVRYTGKKHSQFESVSTYTASFPDVMTEPATIVDLDAGVTFENIVLRLYATNLLDSDKLQSTNTSSSSRGPIGIAYGPRTVGVSVNVNF